LRKSIESDLQTFQCLTGDDIILNRHNLGGFFVGFAFALIAMSTITVLADNLSQIDVSLGKVKLMVHGNSIDRETILFNGTTFVPLRAVAEVLDQEVSYDSTISTAYIDTKGINRQAQIDAMQRANKEIEYYYGLDRIPRFDIFSGISGRTLEGSSAGDWEYIIYGHGYDSISETTINNYGNLLIAKGFIPIDFDR